MTIRTNFSTQLSDLATLKRVAARAGFLQTRGPGKGQGSIRRLLEAIAAGEVNLNWGAAPSHAGPTSLIETQRLLLADGLISEVRVPDLSRLSPFEPVTVEGQPISQMLLEERR